MMLQQRRYNSAGILFSSSYRCDVRVYALIPVQEAFHVDLVTDVQGFYSLVYIAVLVAKVGLYCKCIGLSVKGNVEVKVVPFRTGAIIVVKICNIISVCILSGSFYSHALEGYQLVLMVNQLIFAKKICYIKRLCNIFAVLDLEGGYVSNLNFSGPFSLVSGYFDLGARYQLVVFFL